MIFVHMKVPVQYVIERYTPASSYFTGCAYPFGIIDQQAWLEIVEPARRAASYNKRAAMLRLRRQILKDDGFFDEDD
jgi:hypothetical protein